jgi:transcriptional regulator with XRE-family HTH domain
MDYRHVFATNLRRLRHEKGFSQEALAYEAGVNRTYMSKLEKGGSFVGLEVMVRLAGVLEVEPGDFLKPPSRKASRSPKTTRKR